MNDLSRANPDGEDVEGNADLDQIKEAPEGEETKDNASMKDVGEAPETAGDGEGKSPDAIEVKMLGETGKESLGEALNIDQ